MRRRWLGFGAAVLAALSLMAAGGVTGQQKAMAQMPNPSMEELAGLSGDAFDREFLLKLMLHHSMAVMMARPVAESAPHAELRELASTMIADQTREIAQIRGWLRDWYGMDVPDPIMMMEEMEQGSSDHMEKSHGGGNGHMGGSDGMRGLSRDLDQEMRQVMMQAMELEGLPPARMETVFMSMMVMHHQSAIEMAEMAMSRTAHEEVRMLAEDVIRTQSEEQQRMNAWLQAWYGL